MSATNRGTARAKNDFYETPDWLTRAILPYLIPALPRCPTMLEPGFGKGAIARVVEEVCPNCDITGIDIEKMTNRNKVIIADYLTYDFSGMAPYDLILGNPPYNLAQQFVDKSLEVGNVVALLLRINFLGGQKRAGWMRSLVPSVYVTPRRPAFSLNKNGKPGTDATEYAWFVWGLADQGTLHILETEDDKYKSVIPVK